jgi:hypothetical protein
MKNLNITLLLLCCAPFIGLAQFTPTNNKSIFSSTQQRPLRVQERADSVFLIDYQFDVYHSWFCTDPELIQTYQYDNLNRKKLYDFSIYEWPFDTNTTRDLYHYDSNGKVDKVISGYTNNNSIFDPSRQDLYFYDGNNDLVQQLRQNILGQNYARYLYVNNASGELIERRYEIFDANGNWQLRGLVQYTRNSNNQILSSETLDYFPDSINLSAGTRINAAFNPNGNQIYDYKEEWNNNLGVWLPKSEIITAYSPSEQIISKEYRAPITFNSPELEPKNKSIWTYSNDGLIATRNEQIWNNMAWTDYTLTHYQYENAQLVKDSIFENIQNQWQLSTRSFYVPATDYYGSYFGANDSIITQNININTNTWHTDSIKTEQYTVLNNGQIEFNFNLWQFDSQVNELRVKIRSITRIHPIPTVSTDEVLVNPSATITPNPYKTGQTIRCIGLENSTDLTFSLYDLDGALISEQNFDGGRGLVLPAKVGAGVYIAVIQQGAQRLKTTKIVVVD